ncbi:hypothetical protein ACMXYR_02700 [Neptuniibacter sp. QD29_5]|uniref:hypothetical protein n=1 Tax=Neptuniibacter sp. QD29_5 TaxID=3398207 RepID=UPI0039F53594
MRLMITCPYSYNYRNVIASGLVEELLKNDAFVLIAVPYDHLGSSELKALQDEYDGKLDIIEFKNEFGFLNKLLLILFRLWCYKLQSTKTYNEKSKYLFLTDKIEWIKYKGFSKFFPKKRAFYDFLLRKLSGYIFKSESAVQIIKKYSPEIVISTMSNKYDEGQYLWQARRQGIEIIGLVHSWDVITTKGFFPIKPDSAYFWSLSNLMEYEKYVDRNHYTKKKKICGPVQFDIYREDLDVVFEKKTRGIPLNKKVILYSTSVSRLVPNENSFIESLISLVNERNDLYLYVRVHPQAKVSEFKEQETENVKIVKPEKNSNLNLDGVKFSDNSLNKLHGDLAVSDVVVNFASSMALDALAMGKPAIWLNDGSANVNCFYRYEHIVQAIKDLNIPIANTPEEVINLVCKLKGDGESYKALFEKSYSVVGDSKKNIISNIFDKQ